MPNAAGIAGVASGATPTRASIAVLGRVVRRGRDGRVGGCGDGWGDRHGGGVRRRAQK
ncbi:hypothetical protein [Actinomadura sp. CNU-125]|uniref:hypothetical protein n=1 Tax=Actinomadura sp. CNU-125 TaxID=1904961 RepID=UPI0013017A2F|nr:hypothetical protein [Actinomadura sp. CNU-125]